MLRALRALVLALLGASAAWAWAGEAQPVAADVALEARVNLLAAELRCLVCQNQSLADSNAALAVDLKNQVREQLRAGRSERQVVDYMTERYGDFVLYRPPLKATTLLLWAGPGLLVLLGLAGLWRALVRLHKAREPAPVPGAEAEAKADAERAAALLAGRDSG